MSIAQLFHTVKYLKPGQVTNRLTRRLRKPRRYRGKALTPVKPELPWQVTAALKPSFIVDGEAHFLNEAGPLFEWENPGKSKLWLYNLHYFDDLAAEGADNRTALHRDIISHWIENNPPLVGTGWEPYPLSLRICNWIKWLLAGNAPVDGMQASLVEQVNALSQQVEHHLLGNHILANAKALVFAGVYFEGEAADRWLRAGLAIQQQQLAEQVLADGAHFELSPMYHSIILMDVLDLIQLGQCCPGAALDSELPTWRSTAVAMANWLEGMLHPDGEIPFFNDAAFGIAPPPRSLLEYAQKLGVVRPVAGGATHHYDASGYIAVRQYNQVALLDVAPIGPDYIPGHAHADTLSFEWSLFGQRVLVNSGISEYGLSEERLRQRGTAAHNTVVVNGENSSEVWSGFRVARRARPFGVRLEQTGNCTTVTASHTGYQRLRPKLTHTREWQFTPGCLQVKDTLAGKFTQAVAYFHFHPGVSVSAEGECIFLTLPDGHRCEMRVQGGRAVVEGGTWHPEFGVCEANKCVVVAFSAGALKTEFHY